MSPLNRKAKERSQSKHNDIMQSIPVQEHPEPQECTLDEVDCRVNVFGKHLLLVDDSFINLAVVKNQLENLDAIVDCAQNGKMAFEMFLASDIGFYDVILTDIEMPFMDGHEFTVAVRKLKRSDRNVPIVALTGSSTNAAISRCFDIGMSACI